MGGAGRRYGFVFWFSGIIKWRAELYPLCMMNPLLIRYKKDSVDFGQRQSFGSNFFCFWFVKIHFCDYITTPSLDRLELLGMSYALALLELIPL